MNATQNTLDAIKSAQLNPLSDAITKSYNQALGLVNYDLEPAAKLLFPVLTPLRNRIPRVKGNGGTATNWKAITAINSGQVQAGVSEGKRGGVVTTTKLDYTAAYKGIGLEDDVSFEADYAAEGFDDAKARAVEGLLRATMIQEERLILGGNGAAVALGTTPTPTLVANGSGGSLTAGTLYVACVALTLDGWKRASVSGGVVMTTTRTNADGTTDTVSGGCANKSADATVATVANDSVNASVAQVNGAVAYAWYWGTATGTKLLGAITTVNSLVIKAAATGTQNATAITADKSQDALVFDGLLYQAFKPGSGAIIQSLATGTPGIGTSFTGTNSSCNEIDAMLSSFWDNSRLSPTHMFMSAKTNKALALAIAKDGSNSLIRLNAAVNEGALGLVGGVRIGSYIHPFLNNEIKIEVHPDMPDGMVLFYTESVPYPLSGVGNICQIKTRRDYYQIEWPVKTRKYEYGVYVDELLQHYFPPALGVLFNIDV
jgi:hypothetical protein